MSVPLKTFRFFSAQDMRDFPVGDAREVLGVLEAGGDCALYIYRADSKLADDGDEVIQPTTLDECGEGRGRWLKCLDGDGGAAAAGPSAHAATVVVDQAGNGDAVDIATGIGLLPAGGGLVFVREGVYPITAALVLPAANISIVGTGRESVRIDLASNPISCFEAASDRDILIRDISVRGDTAIDQTFFKITAVFSSFLKTIRFENVIVGPLGGGGIRTLFDVPATGRYAFKATNCLFELGFTAFSFLHKGAADTDLIFTDVAVRGDMRIEDHIRNFDWQNLIAEPAISASSSRPTGAWTLGTVRFQGIVLSSSTCTGFTVTGTGNLPNTIANSTVSVGIVGFISFPNSMNISNSLISSLAVSFGDDCVMAGGFLRSSPTALAVQRRCKFTNLAIQATIATAGGALGDDVLFSNCDIGPPTTVVGAAVTITAGDTEVVFTGCRFTWTGVGTVGFRSSGSKITLVGCTFAPLSAVDACVEVLAGTNMVIGSCSFTGTTSVRFIDVVAGANDGVIHGCNFQTFVTDAIRMAATGWNVGGNTGDQVTEIAGADSNRYAGIDTGLSTIVGPLSIVENWNTRLLTSGPVLLGRLDRTLIVDATALGFTVNLPPAADVRYHKYTFKKSTAANTVTVDGDLAETIDGAATKVLTSQFEAFTIQSDGTAWHVVSPTPGAGGAGTPFDPNAIFPMSLMNALL